MIRDPEKRFWSYVDKSGHCWLWGGAKEKHGYGYFGFRGRIQKAHRVAYLLTFGAIPDGMNVCHHCDNPSCCRPEHLFIGTQKNNVDDMIRKGRYRNRNLFGSAAPWSKLSEKDVLSIRERGLKSVSFVALAKEYGISTTSVFDAFHGRTWCRVKNNGIV